MCRTYAPPHPLLTCAGSLSLSSPASVPSPSASLPSPVSRPTDVERLRVCEEHSTSRGTSGPFASQRAHGSNTRSIAWQLFNAFQHHWPLLCTETAPGTLYVALSVRRLTLEPEPEAERGALVCLTT